MFEPINRTAIRLLGEQVLKEDALAEEARKQLEQHRNCAGEIRNSIALLEPQLLAFDIEEVLLEAGIPPDIQPTEYHRDNWKRWLEGDIRRITEKTYYYDKA